MAKIGIVTVLYNSAPVLKDFFESLEKQTFKDFELFVIDNNSTDDSLIVAKELSRDVTFSITFSPQESNWGVAKGNNIGIRLAIDAGCDYILLANNDIILDSNAIEYLLNGMEENNASLAVSKIYYWNTDSIIWCAGGYFRMYDCSSCHFGFGKHDSPQYDVPQKVDYAPTCFMLIKSAIFEQVGFMDENYFVYYDDSDFVWRVTKKKLETLFYIPNSVIWHKESFSTGGNRSNFSLYFLSRNRIYFAFKHLSLKNRIVLYFFLIIHYIVRDIFILSAEQRKVMRNGWRDGKRLVVEKGINKSFL